MQKTEVLSLGALFLALTSLIVCHAASRVQGETHLLPVERFPQQLGVWRVTEHIDMPPEIQHKLPTAHIEERIYTDSVQRQWDLLLLTATDDQDFHQPTACLPGQGWKLGRREVVTLDGHPVNQMQAERDGHSVSVVYYWVKLKNLTAPRSDSLMGHLYALRSLVDHESLSLFVRIIVPDSPLYQDDLPRFASEVWKALGPILGSQGEIVLRD